jgi:HD-like signal output (HDOD) protein
VIEPTNYESMLRDLAIPPRPEVVVVLFEEMRKDSPDMHRVTKVIAADPGLSAGMLRSANSPFFGLSRKVSSVPQAVKVLGLKHVANIAHGLALRNAFKSAEQATFFEKFWNDAEKTGMLCHFLARSLRGVPADEAYTYGLFHNCGVPLLVQRFPGYRETMMRAAQRADVTVTKVEEEETGTSHAILGYFLARSWMLPDELCQAILIHHDVAAFRDESTPDAVRNLVGIGHLAKHIQQRWLGNLDDAVWAEVADAVSDHFGLTAEDIANLIDRGHAAIEGDH